MNIIESIIWFVMPILLSLPIGTMFQRKKGISVVKFIGAGIVLGILGVLFAPTVSSISLQGKIIGSFIFSLVVNSAALIAVGYWFIDKSNK